MHVALDGTPLLGRRTGIGRYTEHLLTALAQRTDLTVSATAFTLRGAGGLAEAVPPGVGTRSLPVPARLLRVCWTHLQTPPVEWFSGRADVFHGTNFVLPPAGRAGGVVTVHDLAYLSLPDTVDTTSRALRDLVPRSLARAAAVCTPTRAVAELLVDAYGPATPEIVVTPLGVDPEWLAVDRPDGRHRRTLRLPADYFLFVGTREPRKDLTTLLAAYQRFRDDWRSADSVLPAPPGLLLVGPAGWGPDDRPGSGVTIRDYAPTDELRHIVAGARALVMPSRDEGFGLPVLEGLAAGVPVIVSSAPALVEVGGDEVSVFPVGDADALAAALAAHSVTADDPDAVERTADPQARLRRRHYAAGWTWQRCADATVRAYRIAER